MQRGTAFAVSAFRSRQFAPMGIRGEGSLTGRAGRRSVPLRGRWTHRSRALVTAAVIMGLSLIGLLLLPFEPPGLARGLLPSLLVVAIILSAVWIALQLLEPLFERITEAKGGSNAHARSIWRVV